MSKKLTVGSDIFDYPTTGTSNYGEEATGWAEAITEVAKEIIGPGDITLQTVNITALLGNIDEGDSVTNALSSLSFSTSTQKFEITGVITRTYTGLPTQAESFAILGAYNQSEFNITVSYDGDDTEVEFYMIGGQFYFRYYKVIDPVTGDDKTENINIKFRAKTITTT